MTEAKQSQWVACESSELLLFRKITILEFEALIFMYKKPRCIEEISELAGYFSDNYRGARVLISTLTKKGYVLSQGEVKYKTYHTTNLANEIIESVKARIEKEAT